MAPCLAVAAFCSPCCAALRGETRTGPARPAGRLGCGPGLCWDPPPHRIGPDASRNTDAQAARGGFPSLASCVGNCSSAVVHRTLRITRLYRRQLRPSSRHEPRHPPRRAPGGGGGGGRQGSPPPPPCPAPRGPSRGGGGGGGGRGGAALCLHHHVVPRGRQAPQRQKTTDGQRPKANHSTALLSVCTTTLFHGDDKRGPCPTPAPRGRWRGAQRRGARRRGARRGGPQAAPPQGGRPAGRPRPRCTLSLFLSCST